MKSSCKYSVDMPLKPLEDKRNKRMAAGDGVSSTLSPENHPLLCPTCGVTIWKYNLFDHYNAAHCVGEDGERYSEWSALASTFERVMDYVLEHHQKKEKRSRKTKSLTKEGVSDWKVLKSDLQQHASAYFMEEGVAQKVVMYAEEIALESGEAFKAYDKTTGAIKQRPGGKGKRKGMSG